MDEEKGRYRKLKLTTISTKMIWPKKETPLSLRCVKEEEADEAEEGVDEEVGEGWGVFGLCKTIFKVRMSTPSRSATLVRAIESQ